MPPLEAPLIGIDRHRLATDGDGITTLVAFHECPLRCAYCINAQCFKESPECKLTVDKLIERLMPDNIYFLATGGGVTFGGGEPLLYADFRPIGQIAGWNTSRSPYTQYVRTVESFEMAN